MYYLEFKEPISPIKATRITLWCMDQDMKFIQGFDRVVDKYGFIGTMYTGIDVPDKEAAVFLKLMHSV